jgi:IS5 family transposase
VSSLGCLTIPKISNGLYNISDEELEYQVNDRLSFMQFLGLGLEDRVPDATTVWLFRERLQQYGLVEELFEQFGAYLQGAGYAAKDGQIVDATLIPVPKQRNTREENPTIKQGEVPAEWLSKPHKLAQKDVAARWTKKSGMSYYGYKNHVNSDVGFKFIRRYTVTDASVHDSQVLGELLDADNPGDGLWADSAYLSVLIVEVLALMGFEAHINERAYRNRPLSEEQKTANRERSKIRARVEHVFGDFVTSMGGKVLRSIGLARAQTQLTHSRRSSGSSQWKQFPTTPFSTSLLFLKRSIVEKGADYVLALKDNQPSLFEDVQWLFEQAESVQFQDTEHDVACSVDKGHGRLEIRRCWTLSGTELDYLVQKPRWKGLQTIAMIESERRVDGKVTRERRYYLSSLGQDAAVLNAAIRTHWAIENGLHWVLDVAFAEDGCRIRKDHAPQNMTVLRQIALNLLGQDKATKVGIRAKRKKAGWDDAYLIKILTQ